MEVTSMSYMYNKNKNYNVERKIAEKKIGPTTFLNDKDKL